MLRTCALAVAVLTMLTTASVAQDKKKVENPRYTSWAKFKPGTTITEKSVTVLEGQKKERTSVTKLVAVTDDKVTIEFGPKDAPYKQDVSRWLKDGEKPDPVMPENATEDGTETLKVGGMEIKTKRYKAKRKTPDGEAEAQYWVSDDVPDQVVKMVMKQGKDSVTSGMIEFTKK